MFIHSWIMCDFKERDNHEEESVNGSSVWHNEREYS
jgi:hypothetical protein